MEFYKSEMEFYKSELEEYKGFIPIEELKKVSDFADSIEEKGIEFLMDRDSEGYDCNFHCQSFRLISSGGVPLFNIIPRKTSDERYHCEVRDFYFEAVVSWYNSAKRILSQSGYDDFYKSIYFHHLKKFIEQVTTGEIRIEELFKFALFALEEFSEITEGLSAYNSLREQFSDDEGDPNIKSYYQTRLEESDTI